MDRDMVELPMAVVMKVVYCLENCFGAGRDISTAATIFCYT